MVQYLALTIQEKNGYAVKSDDGLTYGPHKDSGELKANRGNSDSY